MGLQFIVRFNNCTDLCVTSFNGMYRSTILLITLLSFLYCSAQNSMNVELLDNWNDTLVPDNGFGATYNEVWGFVQNGNEYAVIASTQGAHIFIITQNNELEEITMVPGAFQGPVIHRDYHDYNGYLYAVCQQGTSSLQVIDLHDLPNSAPVVFDDTLVTIAHNVFIDSTSAKMYIAGPPGHAMSVYSLNNPTEPEFIMHFDEVDYVHDMFVRNDTAWLNCAGQGLFVYDFEETTNPQLIGSLTSYPDQGYCHSGWLSRDGDTYVFADETEGMRMKVCNTADLGDIDVVGLFNSEQDSGTVPHNLMLKEQYVYVSHYNDGLQIFDISDPENPTKAGFYDTFLGPDTGSHFFGAWGIYAFLPSGRLLLSDRQSGLYLFQFNAPVGVEENSSGMNLNLFPNPNNGTFTISGLEASGQVQMEIFDVSGKLLLTTDRPATNTIRLSVPSLNHGFYILRLRNRTVWKQLPFVVD